MNADEKRKVFEELLEKYQDVILSEFSYEDGEREAERKAWLNKYDGIKEPLIKDEKIRKAVRAWAKANELSGGIRVINEHFNSCKFIGRWNNGNVCLEIEFKTTIAHAQNIAYTITELCGEEEE